MGSSIKLEQEEVQKDGRTSRGPVTLINQAVYTGQWLGDKRDGFGHIVWPDKSSYEGEWKNDKIHG